jgi:hypothetical protein
VTGDGSASPDAIPDGAIPVPPRRQTPLYRTLARWLLQLEAWLQSHGGASLRWGIRGFWAAVAAIGVLLLIGPVINEPLSFEDITSSAGEATDTWIARSIDTEYELERDDDGRLVLHVVERITAFFPDDVDEHAIERVIATQYEGHDLRPVVRDATLDGRPVAPDVDAGATTTTITVDAGERLSGDHDVVLRYDLHDVAHPAQDPSSKQPYEQLQWDVFGPDWTHASASRSLTLTVPKELVAAYAREPSAGIAWLLLSDATTLTPERTTADAVVYLTDNDQNMPPYASFWFTLRFAPGTFTMPAPSALYWVQVVGPFVPLLLLLLTVPLALAARAVAWADARGRAWFTMQERPRRGSTVQLDARLWRARRTSALVDALAAHRAEDGPVAAQRLVRVARRTGRLGDLPAAWTAYRAASAYRAQFGEGLRRIPRGFVRDGFIGGAIAFTALQWGLVRQLSFQVPLSEYWWPGAIVLVTTALAALVLAVALSARPLTREGAHAMEHLRGQELFLSQTSALDRTTLGDPLLPYIVAFAPPRRAGRLVTGLLEREGVAGAVRADPAFVTGPRLALRVCAVAVFVAACALSFLTTASTRHGLDHFELLRDVDGDYGVYVSDVDIDAQLVPASGGRLRIEVVETLQATVDQNLRAIPQVTRVWRDRVDGHDQRLRVEEITVDGADVPFEQSRLKGHAFVQSRLPDEWPGEHEITVRYVLEDAASALQADGRWLDQVRWTALLPWWQTTWEGVDHEPRTLHIALRLPAGLADALTDGSGWLDELPHRSARTPVEFEVTAASDGEAVIELRADSADEYEPGSLWPGASDYVGLQLRFEAGTVATTAQGEWRASLAIVLLPYLLAPLLAVLATVLAALGILSQRAGSARVRGGLLRDAVRWIPPWLTAAQLPLLGWATADMYSDDPLLPVLLIALGVSATASIWVLVATRSRSARKPGASARLRRSRG